MSWLTELKVGDTVYFVHRDDRYQKFDKNVTVEKKGRKWLTLSNRSRVDITQKLDRSYAPCDYIFGSPDRIYPSEQAYNDSVSINKLKREVKDRINYGHLTDGQILAISEILCINRT